MNPSTVLAETTVGYRWLLVGVTNGDGVLEITASLSEAWLDLHADGELSWNDGVNFHSSRFELTSTGFRLDRLTTTLVGYAGDDPQRLATIDGMQNVLMRRPHGSAERTEVQTRLDDSLLILQAPGTTLNFRRAGRVRYR